MTAGECMFCRRKANRGNAIRIAVYDPRELGRPVAPRKSARYVHNPCLNAASAILQLEGKKWHRIWRP